MWQKRVSALGITVMIAVLALGGCNNQQHAEVQKTTNRAGSEAKRALQKAEKVVSDSSITARDKSAMVASMRLDSSGINVDTKNKVVYLTGTTANPEDKILAERIARDTVSPNIKVVNQLKPRSSTKSPAKKKPKQ